MERGHGTHQDRLIKKLRLRGIANCAAANAFVEQEYLPAHNARFAVAPASAVDHHRPRHWQRRADVDVFCLESGRVVGNDHVVQYGKRALQLERTVRGRVPPKSRVLVRETEDGALRVVHVARDGHERVLRWTEAAPRPERRATTVAPPSPAPAPAKGTQRPAADHPWHTQHARWSARGLARRAAREARAALPETVKDNQ